MLYSKYLKNKNTKTWEKYRIRRNLVNKLKKTSENTYFQERCLGGSKSSDFWSTMKSYFSKTSCSSNNKIILQEGENIVSDNQGVAEVFNGDFL